MSYADFISLPREPKLYPLSEFLGREGELAKYHISTKYRCDDDCFSFSPEALSEDGIASVHDNKVATFGHFFRNEFVYKIYTYTKDVYRKEIMEITKRYGDEEFAQWRLDRESMNSELEKYWKLYWAVRMKALHTFLNQNLSTGEFAEIMTVLLMGKVDENHYAAPETECTITLEELLNIPMPKETITMHKTTIHKTM